MNSAVCFQPPASSTPIPAYPHRSAFPCRGATPKNASSASWSYPAVSRRGSRNPGLGRTGCFFPERLDLLFFFPSVGEWGTYDTRRADVTARERVFDAFGIEASYLGVVGERR